MEVTKKAEYAISALIELAINRDQFTSSKEIAASQNIPPNFLPQIIALLGSRGWVEGVRGPGGGVRLISDPTKITIREVVELIEGPVAITRCLGTGSSCVNEETCPLHSIWSKAQTAMLEVLSDTTIADVVEAKKVLERNAKNEV